MMGGQMKSDAAGRSLRKEENPTCCGCRFPLLLALLQLLLGIAIAVIAFIIAATSPSLLARETPHWAGIIMCVVALVGFVLCLITYWPDEKTSLQFIVKVLYFVLCMVGVVISVLVIAFQGHHYSQANGFSCREQGDGDCVCTLDPMDPIARTFLYEAVGDCSVVTETLKMYILLEMVLSLVQAVVCAVAAFILWKHRYQVFFAGTQAFSLSMHSRQKV